MLFSALFAAAMVAPAEKVSVIQFVLGKSNWSTSLHLDFARNVMSKPDLR